MTHPNVVNRVPAGTKLSDLTGDGTELERAFQTLLRQNRVGGWVREHRFHPTRGWRFDFAWTDAMFAVEIDGLAYDNLASHQTVAGVLADCEKYEAAMLGGWVVYRVPGPWLADRPAQVIDAVRGMLAGLR